MTTTSQDKLKKILAILTALGITMLLGVAIKEAPEIIEEYQKSEEVEKIKEDIIKLEADLEILQTDLETLGEPLDDPIKASKFKLALRKFGVEHHMAKDIADYFYDKPKAKKDDKHVLIWSHDWQKEWERVVNETRLILGITDFGPGEDGDAYVEKFNLLIMSVANTLP